MWRMLPREVRASNVKCNLSGHHCTDETVGGIVSTGKLGELVEVGVALFEECLSALLGFVHEIIH